MKKILITGCAGFIGSNLTDKLLKLEYQVVGMDNFNDYYDPKIKENNLKNALTNKNFKLYREDILNFEKLKKIFIKEKFEKIVHLAARAGVRPSISDPQLYYKVNIEGTVNLLKLSVDFKVDKFVFGSSSSVYGNSNKLPFLEDDLCDKIISPYGASKRSAEFFVESFWHSFGLKSQVLRFFTVYGPRGRPDMAPALFTKAILKGETIKQFGDGSSSRDYTYIDDITGGIVKAINKNLNFEILNLGNNKPVALKDFILTMEKITGKRAKIEKLPAQMGDVVITHADITKTGRILGWKPVTKFEDGLQKYIAWINSFSAQ
ncbi:MAG: epimerase [Candidatus Portnoybacteria bacterium CG10_big_fil_rev_8_21_14_0_10_36_7]|uniref:Epimerase n=1 Tax=Candidatus Portnoybacteria bacterium CG10_big_fil_rev_8_21_14_0_10_36_7 TaxID=1974812 RepID=A0A2M8KDN3_9BACT|nr:MAG: epimerase [Candidatus Portnoybacteria bacterium CG10_big_fil_rev_8_21_14_0_10_36_7]